MESEPKKRNETKCRRRKNPKTNSLRNCTSGGDNSIQRNFSDYLLLHAATLIRPRSRPTPSHPLTLSRSLTALVFLTVCVSVILCLMLKFSPWRLAVSVIKCFVWHITGHCNSLFCSLTLFVFCFNTLSPLITRKRGILKCKKVKKSVQ